MKDIEVNELKNIKGGGISPWIFVGIGAGLVLISGIVDGYVRPLACYRRRK